MTSPTLSIIIPRKAGVSAEDAIHALQRSDYPQHLVEILEVVGQNPSRQRNLGANAARGDLVYFLDNDSIVTPTLFTRVVQDYTYPPGVHDSACTYESGQGKPCTPGIAGVGGPNLTPPADTFLQKTFGCALASPFAHFSMCARYASIGTLRFSNEKELILCNLSVRRDIFLREGGFDETLYPNEENEFINRLTAKGYRFLYDPDAYVYRSRRHRFLDFLKQFWRYGQGRADQILVEGLSLKALLFFFPLGLLGYLLGVAGLSLSGRFFWWQYLPAVLYAGLALFSALQYAVQERNPFLAAVLPICFLGMHLSYGAGLAHGFLKAWLPKQEDPGSESSPVDVIVRKTFGE